MMYAYILYLPPMVAYPIVKLTLEVKDAQERNLG